MAHARHSKNKKRSTKKPQQHSDVIEALQHASETNQLPALPHTENYGGTSHGYVASAHNRHSQAMTRGNLKGGRGH